MMSINKNKTTIGYRSHPDSYRGLRQRGATVVKRSSIVLNVG